MTEQIAMVGRARARAALDAVSAPALILIGGEAGIGKTRLVSGMRHAGRRFVGRCSPLREPLPLGPVVEALGVAGGFAGLRTLLADAGPATLVIEDLHWADNATWDFLRYLCPRLPDGLRVVLTYRPEETRPIDLAAGAPAAVEITLSPLTKAEGAELAAAHLGVRAVSAAFADRLHALTAGVPFVIEEVVRALPDSTALFGDLQPSVALRGSFAQRLDRVSAPARAAVVAAAVFAVPVEEALLGTPEAVDEALEAGLLVTTGPGRFSTRHALASRAIEDLLGVAERRAAHRAAADALAKADPVPALRLAHHSREAGRVRDWVRYAVAAGEQAHRTGEGDAVVGLLAGALAAPGLTRADRLRLATLLGKVAAHGSSHDVAIKVLRASLTEDFAPVERGEIRFALAMLLCQQGGDRAEGRHQLTVAADELAPRPELAARAMAALAVAGDGTEAVAERRKWAARALALLDDVADPEVRTAVRVNHATVLVFACDPGGRAAAERVLAEPGVPAQLCRAAVNFADAAAWLGHPEDARRMLTRARALADEDEYLDAVMAGTRLRADFAAGDWAGLAERAEVVRADAWRLPEVDAEARLVLGELALARGDLVTARHELCAVAEIAAADLSMPMLLAARTALARIGPQPLTELVVAVRKQELWVWAADLVPLVVRDCDDAEGLLDEIRAGLAGLDAPLAAAGAHLTAGMVHGDETEFTAAVEGYRRLGRPYSALRAAEVFAELRLRSGDEKPLARTAAGYTALGASWDAARCAETLRRNGYRIPHRRGRRGYGQALSPREKSVAELAGRGLTNRQIAESLFLSIRTVEAHVASAMRKRRVRDRRLLAGE
ncbi:LuxR C-terminal-related transcriptional regulator [Amycolatopsis albispora]|uniref:LuxR C-terminal-related transcriptional regulator n=1 Tax=Amycolatopsis albispora TaxID=1804986 RepID=UPI0013B3E1F5|nr:LuxR C-terminal-related transcriptional regulator [Amycolatopsis albispora]